MHRRDADRHRSTPARPRAAIVTGVFVPAGFAAGVLAKYADLSETWLSDAATYLSVWVVALVVIAVMSNDVARASVRAVLGFVAMCSGYYVTSFVVLGIPLGREVAIWLALALVVVPMGAAIVHWSSVADRWYSAVLAALMAGLCLVSGAVPRLLIALTESMPDYFWSTVRPVQAMIDVASAVAILVLIPRTWTLRAAAFAAVIPSYMLVSVLAPHVFGRLGV